MLLGFVAWTVLLLVGTVGVYRWSRILTGLWRYEISGLIRLREKIGKTRNAGTCKLRRKSTRLCYDRLCIVRRKRDQQSREYIGHCNSDCPRSAIAGTCMLRSDKHRGVDTICFLCGSDHWLSIVDCSHMGFCCQVFRSSATRRYSNSRDSPRRSPIEIRAGSSACHKKADLSDIQIVWDNGKNTT